MQAGDIMFVPFALKPAKVRLKQAYFMADGDTVWHVQDVISGHCDFVREDWMRPTNESEGKQS